MARRWPGLRAWLRSLRAQILLWTLLPIIIFLLGLSFTDVYGHQEAMHTMVQERDHSLVQSAAARIAESLESNSRLLSSLARDAAFREAGPAAQGELLGPLSDIFADGILVVDGQGRSHAASRPTISWQQAPFVAALARAALEQDRPAYLGRAESGLAPFHLAVAVALPDKSGALVGVLPLSSSAIAEAVDGLQVAPEAEAVLLDSQGQPIYRVGRAAGEASATPLPNEALVTTSLPVPNTGWQLVLSEPWHRLVPLVLRYAQATVLIAIAAILISLLAVYFGLRYVTRPLQELGQEANRMAWGDFDAVLTPVGGVEEIADLQRTLREMASQVRSYQAAMRNYVAAVTRAQEEERLRLARELHDDTVQSLIALGQRLERVQKAALHRPELCAAQLDELRHATRSLVQDLRRLIGDLRPTYLDDLGLAPALEMLLKTVPSDCRPELTVIGPERRLSPDVELAIYRIAQAALKNVAQHAQARHVHLSLSFEERGVRIVIEDDGQGFSPPSSPDELAREGHFGLLGMRERAMLFGGWLALSSQPGHGTRVEAYLPTVDEPGPASIPPPAWRPEEYSGTIGDGQG